MDAPSGRIRSWTPLFRTRALNTTPVSLAAEVEKGNAPVLLRRERRRRKKEEGDIPCECRGVVVRTVWGSVGMFRVRASEWFWAIHWCYRQQLCLFNKALRLLLYWAIDLFHFSARDISLRARVLRRLTPASFISRARPLLRAHVLRFTPEPSLSPCSRLYFPLHNLCLQVPTYSTPEHSLINTTQVLGTIRRHDIGSTWRDPPRLRAR